MSAAVLVQMAADWLKESMVERGLDVPALAEAAGVSQKTIYSILGGRAVRLVTAGKVYRALDRSVAFAEESRRGFLEPARHPTQRLRVVSPSCSAEPSPLRGGPLGLAGAGADQRRKRLPAPS